MTANPYLLGLEPNVHFESLLTAGDVVNGKIFGGTPDGIGAFDNGDGTITILLNHEIAINGTFSNPASAVHDHGSAGSWVDAIVLDKTTHEVISLSDLGQTIYQDNDGDGVYTQATTAISRLCSADLASVNAFFYAGADGIVGTADDVGTTNRIFLNGEEQGIGNGTPTAGGGAYDSRAFAWIATGADKGSVFELPGMGNTSFENLVASPNSGAKTVVMMDNDTSPAGQVYVYVGNKQATGNDIQKAGLVGGHLFGIVAEGIGAASNTSTDNGREASQTEVPTSGSFALADLGDVSGMTGTQILTAANAAGVSGWWRPEDGAWDNQNPNKYYFVTTASQTASTRLWSLTYTDITHPELGGTFKLEFQGTVGTQVMFDNVTVDQNGHVILCEDPGSYNGASKVWDYDPASGQIHLIAKHDPALFGDGDLTHLTTPPTAPFTTDEESSGVIDVTSLLGDANTKAYLIDTQAHYLTGDPNTVEGGQLQVMYVDTPTDGGRGDDSVNGGYTDDTLNGKGGADLIRGGSGDDSLRGSSGEDTLIGGAGADTLKGGDQVDVFQYNAASEGGDTILHFKSGYDAIWVSASGFGGGLTAGGGLAADQFVAGSTATAAHGQFLFDAATKTLLWDADGTGAGAAVMIAHVEGHATVSGSDIHVIA
ncbi:MAG TPA: hypothetical protein VE684_07630 [Crenalkalicoccus sp.]|nr:hypothetical protein [Crenalkalicoccus sp.]